MYLAIFIVSCVVVALVKISRKPPPPKKDKTGINNNQIPVDDTKKEDLRKEIQFQGRLYDVTNFIGRHPGGNIIQFYVNNSEDATEAIQQFHFRAGGKVQRMLQAFPSREVPPDFLVAPTHRKYREMTEDFQKLFQQFVVEGHFEASWTHVILRLVEIILFGVLSLALARWNWTILAGLVLGLFQYRISWVMHEGGHNSLTGIGPLDKAIQAITLCGGIGLSAAWWRSQHNRHHAMPQRMNHDVDLDTMPGLAYNIKLLDNREDEIDVFLLNQAHLYVPLIASGGLIGWKMYLHPQHAIVRRNYPEIFLLLCHWAICLTNFSAVSLIIAHMFTSSALMVNFGLSHSHLPLAEEPRHWLEYSFLHTMNIQPSWWCDWWMGYLNYQIEHHLFPTMPQFRQRALSARVRAVAEKHGLPYQCVSYLQALRRFFNNLHVVSQKAGKIAEAHRN